MTMELSRRALLQGGVAAGAAVLGGVVAASSLTSCAPQGDGAGKELSSTGGQEVPSPITTTYDCDIVVMGCGFSGLAACVQAAESGAKVIGLEASTATGGGAYGIEGTLGIDTPLSRENGVTVDTVALLNSEMQASQWRADGLCWLDLLNNSADNIDWLIGQGVPFSGLVDDYWGREYATFHWYEGGHASEGYSKTMTDRAEELGVQFLLSTTGKQLVFGDDGSVAGVYAETADGWIQVNAKAVIMAGGSFANDPELLSHIGFHSDRILMAYEGGLGHSLRMAISAGGRDDSVHACGGSCPAVEALPPSSIVWGVLNEQMFYLNYDFVWINENCERFFREDAGSTAGKNLENQTPPQWAQKDVYILFDSAMYEKYALNAEDFEGDASYPVAERYMEVIDEAVKTNNGNSLYRSDTIAGLAEPFGLDPQALEKFVSEYNAMCAAGKDTVWGKDPQYLLPLSTPPYYIAKPVNHVMNTFGGIATNRHFQVITNEREPIERLYTIGNDGCMLYRNVYNIGVPGGISAHCVNSGRNAAKHAVEHCL